MLFSIQIWGIVHVLAYGLLLIFIDGAIGLGHSDRKGEEIPSRHMDLKNQLLNFFFPLLSNIERTPCKEVRCKVEFLFSWNHRFV